VKKTLLLAVGLLAMGALGLSQVGAEDLSGDEIIKRVMKSDPWGLSGAEIAAHLTLIDKSGAKSRLTYSGKSMQYDPPLAKSVVRFSAPADLAGAAFLQVQKKEGDDERFMFLPELKRARRIAGGLRSNAFMGTDFTFADLDRRDWRESSAVVKTKETLGKHSCYVVHVTPKSADSDYSYVEMWVDEENFLPLKFNLYDRSKVLVKIFEALETKRVSGAWFISKSKMTNVQQKHTTELQLDQIAVKDKFPEDEFSVRALEKI